MHGPEVPPIGKPIQDVRLPALAEQRRVSYQPPYFCAEILGEIGQLDQLVGIDVRVGPKPQMMSGPAPVFAITANCAGMLSQAR